MLLIKPAPQIVAIVAVASTPGLPHSGLRLVEGSFEWRVKCLPLAELPTGWLWMLVLFLPDLYVCWLNFLLLLLCHTCIFANGAKRIMAKCDAKNLELSKWKHKRILFIGKHIYDKYLLMSWLHARKKCNIAHGPFRNARHINNANVNGNDVNGKGWMSLWDPFTPGNPFPEGFMWFVMDETFFTSSRSQIPVWRFRYETAERVARWRINREQ